MSDKLVINPHPASLNYSGQLPIRSHRKTIRSSSSRGTNIYKPQNSLPYLSCQPMGGFEPDLNGFLSQPVGVEFESNCSRITVNQAKILFQSQELPPLNPTTNKKIDHQNIFIGFGGGAEGGGGLGPFELDSFRLCAAVNPRLRRASLAVRRLHAAITHSCDPNRRSQRPSPTSTT